MIIDSKLIVRELEAKLKSKTLERDPRLTLGIIVTHETPASHQYANIKQAFGKKIGVKVDFLKLASYEQENTKLLELIMHSTRKYDGIILQLPLPPHFFLENVLNIFPFTHDVDLIGNTGYQQYKERNLPLLPPVVGAFSEILKRSDVKLTGKNVVIFGEGRLVGGPSVVWATRLGATVTVITKETTNVTDLTMQADIIILGTGTPGLLKPDMIQEGVMILDAGSGQVDGVVQGDADPACAEKSSLFTPTPGGVGPITVAKMFENLVVLNELRNK